jgi:hypothetical protein
MGLMSLPIKPDLFFSLWSFNFSIFLFHLIQYLNWLRNGIHGLFFSTFYRVITISNKYWFYVWYLILKASNVNIKLNKKNYKNNKVVKSIEVHNSSRRVIKVNLIWHYLNIKKIVVLIFLKKLLCFYRSSKLFFDPLNWIIHFELTLMRFNSKLELDKKSGWQVLKLNRLIGFNDIIKKIFIFLIFFKFRKKNPK